jgi:site-specific DNA-methyltransferase (adenine-specific)
MSFQVIHGDCLEVLRGMADNSVDAIVTDPPYGLAFMGKRWDYDVPSEAIWRECLRVLKPGGHLLAFAGTRTQHRMAVRIEDAGFEIRDMIAWVYGSGFPKSLDVSKAIDKAAGAEREDVYEDRRGFTENLAYGKGLGVRLIERRPATEAARQWQGWGTALKPALEPITVARKPLAGTVAENVQRFGTGALNIDGCRVGAEKPTGWGGGGSKLYDGGLSSEGGEARIQDAGRWPANLIHDGSEEVTGFFPAQAGAQGKASGPTLTGKSKSGSMAGHFNGMGEREPAFHADTGSAARFFYCAKASKRDRDEGLDGFDLKRAGGMQGRQDGSMGSVTMSRNVHPTVKPTDLMRYLCRLVTPPGGTVLDPFTGSGSTGKAAVLEGFHFIGIEREAEYVEIARARIAAAQKKTDLFAEAV